MKVPTARAACSPRSLAFCRKFPTDDLTCCVFTGYTLCWQSPEHKEMHVNDTDQVNGQHDEHETIDGTPVALSVADRKKRMAQEAQELRVIFVAERDQLEAERSALWERVKVLNAEIANIDAAGEKVTKVVKAAGRVTTPATPARGKGR